MGSTGPGATPAGQADAKERALDGLERLDAVSRHDSPAHPVDLCVQEPAIRRERLHRSARRRGPHERDEIGWLQLRVDELVEALTRGLEALGREAQVVNDQRNRALDLFLRQLRRRRRRRRRLALLHDRLGRARLFARRLHRHEPRERDVLDLPVLPQLEVLRGQIGDDAAVLVGDDGVDAHGVDADPEDGLRLGDGCRRLRRRPHERRRQHAGNQTNGEPAT